MRIITIVEYGKAKLFYYIQLIYFQIFFIGLYCMICYLYKQIMYNDRRISVW